MRLLPCGLHELGRSRVQDGMDCEFLWAPRGTEGRKQRQRLQRHLAGEVRHSKAEARRRELGSARLLAWAAGSGSRKLGAGAPRGADPTAPSAPSLPAPGRAPSAASPRQRHGPPPARPATAFRSGPRPRQRSSSHQLAALLRFCGPCSKLRLQVVLSRWPQGSAFLQAAEATSLTSIGGACTTQ